MARRRRLTEPATDSAAAPQPVMDEYLGFLVRLVQLDVFEEFQSTLADLGTTPARYSVLAFIGANPGVRPGVVASQLRIKPPNLAVLLNALETEAIIRRETVQTELRASQLWLTPEGIKALAVMRPRVEATDRRVMATLSAAEQGQLIGLLRKVLGRDR
jgi:DNA-binding MarR family transcriptional regulator